MRMKRCSKCDKKYPATTEYFYQHKSKKDGLDSWCKQCEKKRHQSKKFRITHKKGVEKYRRSEKGKEAYRKGRYKRSYGITLDDYDKMFEQQNGVCAICGEINDGGRRLCVDHDHKTNKIRGLLCGNCNKALGFVKEDIVILSKIANYILENRIDNRQ